MIDVKKYQPQAEPSKTEPKPNPTTEKIPEVGGPTGLEPTRYGDWERGGRCIDF